MVQHAIKASQIYIINNNEISDAINDHGGKIHEFVLRNFYECKFETFKTIDVCLLTNKSFIMLTIGIGIQLYSGNYNVYLLLCA